MFYSAGVVPTRQHVEFAQKLVERRFPSESVVKRGLRHDHQLLSSIGMQAGQQSCLNRYLNRSPAAAGGAAAADPEAAALANLKSLCAAAGVLPDLDVEYEAIALRLIQLGVADEISLRDSLGCSPPAFDLCSVVDQGQACTIMVYLERDHS
jgi:hypothetical protein